ncbi:ABC transporter permease [Mumia sp. Pv 4-285]|uniref:ABC transporter permease n=1 Tax=Mumia qirimensis TaxID=3234852 RepID=UPI00351D67D1
MSLAAGVVPDAVVAADPPCYSRAVNAWVCPEYVTRYAPELWDATVQHVLLTVSAVVLGFVLAVALALVARRRARMRSLLLGSTTLIYTIPSLAMFSLLAQATGLSATTVVIGLGLYSLSILVRNVLTGLDGVPDEVVEAATGLGYGRVRLLLRIEAPLALPVVMAGLRIATVSTVALVTLGTIVAYGGLGNMLANGLDDSFKAQVLTTSVLCVVLAVALDLLLVAFTRLVTPWTRGVAT